MSTRFDTAYLELTRAYGQLHDPAWLRPEVTSPDDDWAALVAQSNKARRVARSEYGRYVQPKLNDRYVATVVATPGATRFTARLLAAVGAALMWVIVLYAAILVTGWVLP